MLFRSENSRTKTSSDFDNRLFWEYYSVPFRMGFLDGGAKAVMASYNAWNGTHMAVNPILKSILVKDWGVDILSSDGGAVKALVKDSKTFPNQKDAVVACLKAGINQFLFDQPKDEQFDLLERIASDVLPKLLKETPRPTSQGVTVDASRWHRPQDHVG